MAPCPRCNQPTPLEVDTGDQKKSLPQWVLPSVSLFLITVIGSAALYGLWLRPFEGIAVLSAGDSVRLYAYCFVVVGASVVSLAFFIYLFNWLRETRALLRQIERNTRPPTAPAAAAPKAEPAEPSPTQPAHPSEEARYMPKT